jgi:DNA-binding LacI/PurR family transcriptional regulator
VKRTPADAWVVIAGSREVLAWFAAQPIPSFALFGRLRELPVAGVGTTKLPAIVSLVRRLVALGHRRIVFLVREEHRGPDPNPIVRGFHDELAALGVPHGPYNVPNWEDSPEGFHQCLNSLFHHTPPTALILDESMLYFTALQFMAVRGIKPLVDVSMVCTDSTPYPEWLNPKVSHIHFESRPLIQRMIRWADNVARGKIDRRQFFAEAKFTEGGTLGPAPQTK